MKVRYRGKEIELWEGAEGKDLLTSAEQIQVEAGEMALWEKDDGWIGLGGALHNNGRYSLLEAKVARLRLLPSVDRILAHPAMAGMFHNRIVEAAHKILDELRDRIQHDEYIMPQLETIIESILASLKSTPAVEHPGVVLAWSNPKVVILADPFQSLCNALQRISTSGVLALPRQHLAEQGGQRVGDYIERAGWHVLPLGTINRCQYADFQKALNAGACAIAYLVPAAYSLMGFVSNVKPEQLAGLALANDVPFLFYPVKTGTSIA